MIGVAMAVTAVKLGSPARALQAREARLPRAVALVFDTIFFSLILNIANAVYGVTQVTEGSPLPIGGSGSTYFGTQTSIPWVWVTVIYVVYFAAAEGVFAATPGKWICGLRVVGVDGRPMTIRRALTRNLLRVLDALPVLYLLGGLSVLVTSNSQRLGDLAAGTTVVHRIQANPMPHSRFVRASLFGLLAAIVLFTALFDYFGRPPLVIEGEYNRHDLMNLVSYSLGDPSWSPGGVTYPIKGRTATGSCTGSIQLKWYWVAGWQFANGRLDCPPG